MENETFRLKYSSKLFPEVSIKIFFAHTLRYHPQTFLICGLWKSVTFKKHIIFRVSYIPSLDASQLVTGREYYMINYKWLLNPMIINAKWKLGSTSCLEQAKWILTFRNLEKVVSSWSAKLLLSLTTEKSACSVHKSLQCFSSWMKTWSWWKYTRCFSDISDRTITNSVNQTVW